jgi:protein disulfide-isomerase-like protein
MLKLKTNQQVYVAIGIFIILLAIFYPRDKSIIGANIGAHVGNIRGNIGLEAFQEGTDGKTLALFYAPWCGFCKRLSPHWNKASEQNKTDVKMVKINCDENPDLAQKFGIEGFPTIYFLPYGLNNPKERIIYNGERSGEALLAFIANK